MQAKIPVIRTDDFKQLFDFEGFLGLPKEEIERFHDSLEVLFLDRAQIENNPAYKKLIGLSVIHFNYSWVTFRQNHMRSMTVYSHIEAESPSLFLDDRYKTSVASQINHEFTIPGKYDLRLAGILNDNSSDLGLKSLGLVYVARLYQENLEVRNNITPDICTVS